jgi:two-component system NtrC family sensor kinase
MRLIVTQLLQFARPTEFAGYVDSGGAGAGAEDCLVLAGHLLARTRIEVHRDYRAHPQRRPSTGRSCSRCWSTCWSTPSTPCPTAAPLGVHDDAAAGEGGGVAIVVADTGPGWRPSCWRSCSSPS